MTSRSSVRSFERRQKRILRILVQALTPFFLTLDPDTHDDARTAVERLVKLVLPGWRVVPPIGCPGPKVGGDERIRRELLRQDYDDFLRDLKRHDFTQRPGESDRAYQARVASSVAQVWNASDAPLFLAAPRDPNTGKRPIAMPRIPLNRATIDRWLASRHFRNAVTKRDYLAYRLSGHIYEHFGGKPLTVNQVRGFVQQQRRRSKRK